MRVLELNESPSSSVLVAPQEDFNELGCKVASEYNYKMLEFAGDFQSKLSELYLIFSKRFPRYEDLWQALAEEAKVQAKWIHVVDGIITKESLILTTDSSLEAVIAADTRELVDLIQNHFARIDRVDQAFDLSLRFELTIGGNRFYDYLKSHPAKVQRLFEDLTVKTRNHVTQLRTVSRQRGRFGKLLDDNLVTLANLEKAQKLALTNQDSADEFLLGTCRVPKRALLESLSNFFHVPAFEFDSQLKIPLKFLDLLLKDEQYKAGTFVPVGGQENRVFIAVNFPVDLDLDTRIRNVFAGYEVEYLVALANDIRMTIEVLLGKPPEEYAWHDSMQNIVSTMEEEPNDAAPLETYDASLDTSDSTVVKLVHSIIDGAYVRQASDIHIEPKVGNEVQVRFRVDGWLMNALTFPAQFRTAVISRLKIMARLDIAEHRKPQSGKICYRPPGHPAVELRVETYPTVAGEDAVLRLFPPSVPYDLDELSLNERDCREFKRMITQSYGLILCVGPTGSGKTTTLHSALHYINKTDVKIVTVEDPVEITQAGLRQVQVHPKAGITFATALRSFLRADPDIIMIGEMRDAETASIAIEGSLTGHLVFSTLHTNTAAETVTRLLKMGVDAYSFADALQGVLAQRLLRKLCPKCNEPQVLGNERYAMLQEEYGEAKLFDALGYHPRSLLYCANPNGCYECGQVGYRKRMLIEELLVVTEPIRDLIYRRGHASDILQTALAQGMRTLKQDGIEKVLQGYSTIEELRTIC